MLEQKKTEEQVRHEIRKKFNFSEETDTERIDTAVEMEKDRFKAVQKKIELKEKLEGSNKPEGKKDPEGKKEDYSISDIRALSRIKSDEDVEWFEAHCKKVGLSPAEAIKDEYVQFRFKKNEEERNTAKASNTSNSRKGSSGKNDSKILDDIEDGKFPEKEEDFIKAARARTDRKKAAIQR